VQALRKELVPMIELGFKSIIDLYFKLIKTSRGSFLFKKILVSKPLVSSEGKSFKAWMAISICLFSNSSSICFEKSLFPPISDRLSE
jgi:hypothetical protein